MVQARFYGVAGVCHLRMIGVKSFLVFSLYVEGHLGAVTAYYADTEHVPNTEGDTGKTVWDVPNSYASIQLFSQGHWNIIHAIEHYTRCYDINSPFDTMQLVIFLRKLVTTHAEKLRAEITACKSDFIRRLNDEFAGTAQTDEVSTRWRMDQVHPRAKETVTVVKDVDEAKGKKTAQMKDVDKEKGKKATKMTPIHESP